MNKISISKKKVRIGEIIKAPLKKDLIKACLLLVCQMAQVFGVSPFASAFFMSLADVGVAYLYIPALVLGAVFNGVAPIRYIISVLMLWVYKAFTKSENRFFNSLVCGVSVFLCGMYYEIGSSASVWGMVLVSFEAVLSFVFCHIFAPFDAVFEEKDIQNPLKTDVCVSVMSLLSVMIIGMSGVVLPFDIELKTVLGVYLVLSISLYAPLFTTVIFSLCAGYLVAFNTPLAFGVAGVFAFSSVFCYMLRYFKNIGSAIGFMTGITISMLMMGNSSYINVSLIDVFISCFIFSLIPVKIHQKTGLFLANALKYPILRKDFRIKEYICSELDGISNTFSEFSRQFCESFQKAYDNDTSSPNDVFDELSQNMCKDCIRYKECYKKGYKDTYKYMNEIYDTICQDGYCDIQNAPLVFTQKCIKPELFLQQFNHIYENQRKKEFEKGLKTCERRLVSNQYVEIAKIISELSKEIEGNFFFDDLKEKEIIKRCQKETLYLKDLSVVKNKEGYWEAYFTAGVEEETEKIKLVIEEELEERMKEAYSSNGEIVKLVCDENFCVEVAVCQKKKDNEPVTGDTIIHFVTEKGKYYIILCDGMGSGYEAKKESRMSAELLAGFLKAGFTKVSAINLVNSTLALKMDREGFSTIDLCEIDLRSGECTFIKIGASQSYIKKGSEVLEASMSGLPAGIMESINTDDLGFELGDNDMVVMVSDGVSEAGYGMMRGEWIKRVVAEEKQSIEELAKSIVNNAAKKIYPRTADDMSAVVVKITKKGEE